MISTIKVISRVKKIKTNRGNRSITPFLTCDHFIRYLMLKQLLFFLFEC